MRLQSPREHPHGLPDHEFDAIFTTDEPINFAFHGCPWLIHRLTYRRNGHKNLRVRANSGRIAWAKPGEALRPAHALGIIAWVRPLGTGESSACWTNIPSAKILAGEVDAAAAPGYADDYFGFVDPARDWFKTPLMRPAP